MLAKRIGFAGSANAPMLISSVHSGSSATAADLLKETHGLMKSMFSLSRFVGSALGQTANINLFGEAQVTRNNVTAESLIKSRDSTVGGVSTSHDQAHDRGLAAGLHPKTNGSDW